MDAEDIFARFVRNANAESAEPVTQRSAAPKPPPGRAGGSVVFDSHLTSPAPSGHVVLLTQRKKVAVDLDADDTQETPALTEEAARQVVATLDTDRMRIAREERDAESVVPNVARIKPPAAPVREGSEDGQMPAGELERQLSDMQVLLRHGHRHEVTAKLEELVRRYPEDLLLLRRIAEFHLENDEREGAIEMLFLLAGRLFERRNVTGMRQAIEQVLVLDPKHRRAYKLLGLLEQRPDTGTG